MSRTYLIDGYNLMHAMGMIPQRLGPHTLEKARGRLVAILARVCSADEATATVVFDAKDQRGSHAEAQQLGSVSIVFAAGYDDADEMIEEIIQKHPAPRRLIVVSDDHRLQRAAGRRRCEVLSCTEFVDQFERLSKGRAAPAEPARKILPTEKERQQWLEIFADLKDDPAMKELFDPFDFDSDEEVS